MARINLTNKEIHTVWVSLNEERKQAEKEKLKSYWNTLGVIMRKMEKVM